MGDIAGSGIREEEEETASSTKKKKLSHEKLHPQIQEQCEIRDQRAL